MVSFNSIPMYLVMDQNIFNFAFFCLPKRAKCLTLPNT